MAALSGDPLLIELIRNNKDLHSETVRRVWPECSHLSDDDIKKHHKDKRDTAKVVLFSLAYGAQTKKIAFVTGRSIPDASRILEAFKKDAYPTLIAWLEGSKEEIKKNGGATLVGGYKRHFKSSGNPFQDEAELRSIVNSLIQGTSAYITKVATLSILRNLKAAGIDHKLVILIHDSVTLQVNDEDVEAAWKIVEDSMYYDLLGVPVVAVGAVNKDMSKVTELDLQTFLQSIEDEDE